MKRQQMAQPISTRDQFSAGGSQIPIVTRNSTQSVAGVQQMGYSVGKTTLGAYRMGDADGNAPGSAIYPDDIFSPLPNRERKQPEVMFQSVGFRTYQPPAEDEKLHALLKKFGDQQFKAIEAQPFEEYFRTQELARQTEQAARISSVEDQGLTREIMRNIVDTRRQSSEADFLRRMVDAGLSPAAAQMEIDNVNRASALQEARTIDDRPYQTKLLISRIAQARGLASQVKDPLTQSAGISNPQNSQDANLAMGVANTGFGVGVERQGVGADFYRRFGRRMPDTQEAQDEQAAVNSLIARGAAGQVTSATQLEGLERSDAIQKQRESAAAKLETLRNRGNKIMLPLPGFNTFSRKLLMQVYGTRKPGEETYFTTEDAQSLTNTQAIIAMNQLLAGDTTGALYREAHRLLRASGVPILKPDQTAGPNVFEILRRLVASLSGGGTIQLPFVGKTIDLSVASGNYDELGSALDRIKTVPTAPAEYLAAAKAAQAARAAAPAVPAAPAAPAVAAVSATAVPVPVPEGEGEESPGVGPLPRDRRGLPPVPSSLTAFKRLKKEGMDTLMAKYGLPLVGSREQQYAALKAF
jgi:hypothetical protein